MTTILITKDRVYTDTRLTCEEISNDNKKIVYHFDCALKIRKKMGVLITGAGSWNIFQEISASFFRKSLSLLVFGGFFIRSRELKNCVTNIFFVRKNHIIYLSLRSIKIMNKIYFVHMDKWKYFELTEDTHYISAGTGSTFVDEYIKGKGPLTHELCMSAMKTAGCYDAASSENIIDVKC